MVEKVSLRRSIAKLDCPAIIAFGNPLLDVYVTIKNDDLLKKFNLPTDGEIELPVEKMQELLADLPLELISIFVNTCYMFTLCIFYTSIYLFLWFKNQNMNVIDLFV